MKGKRIDSQLLDNLSEAANKNHRLRLNYNFHEEDDVCQRFLNAIEPDSYIRPHRHIDPLKDESFIILRGKGGVLIFSESGQISETIPLDPLRGIFGVDIKAGLYHTIVSFESATVFFEVKPGPYSPLTAKEFANWAPQPNLPEAEEYLRSLKKFFK